jgi:hypothetical protein
VTTPEREKRIRCILLMSAVDLPARALLLNMKQYNGMYGCSFCYSEGTTKRGSPLHRFWPPQLIEPSLRTSQSVRENASQATIANDPVKGVKGASVLCLHQPFDLAIGCTVDNFTHSWSHLATNEDVVSPQKILKIRSTVCIGTVCSSNTFKYILKLISRVFFSCLHVMRGF